MRNIKTWLMYTLAATGVLIPIKYALGDEPAVAASEQADYKPGNPIYDRWEKYYNLVSMQPAKAEKVLLELTELSPNDPNVWKSLAYLQINLNKPDDALVSIRRAEQLLPQDEQLKLQQAYLLAQQKKTAEAIEVFQGLATSSNQEVADKAQQAVQNLEGAVNKPTFRDIYIAPSYESRFNAFILPVKVRMGKNFNGGRVQLYGFANLNRDSKSKSGINISPNLINIIDDNVFILGVGANYQPWLKLPIRLYAEVGGRYDLIDRLEENQYPPKVRSKFRESVVLGAAGYQAWEANPSAETRTLFNDYFTDLYGNIGTYSREDYNVIADFTLRSGVYAYRGDTGKVQIYGKLRGLADSKAFFYNNLIEGGAGLSWQPFNYQPLKLQVERLWGHYYRSVPASTSKNYNNTHIQLVYFNEF